jgi:hypothetical protein
MPAMSETQAPPFFWLEDQQRAWRLIAASWQHDGALFDRVVTEARDAGPEAVDKLLAALSRNLVVRLRISLGADGLDELIDAELRGCQAEADREAGGEECSN